MSGFCPGGALAVDGGDLVAARVSDWLSSRNDEYALVVATMDWHPGPESSIDFEHFSDEPDFVDTWPSHCVQATAGAALHPALSLPDGGKVRRRPGTRGSRGSTKTRTVSPTCFVAPGSTRSTWWVSQPIIA